MDLPRAADASISNQENLAEYKHDPALVAGMTTALSNFFNQFEDDPQDGFEIMERDQLCFTSHKTEFSVITLISKTKLSDQFLNKIKEAHAVVEYMFETELTYRRILENGVDDFQLQQLSLLGELDQIDLVDLTILLNYIKSKEIKSEEAANLIFKAYDLGVLNYHA